MTAQQDPQSAGSGPISTGLKRVVLASMAGTVVEWYEFFLYATAATLVFNKVFFSADTSESVGLILALLTYAVGFVARPLGGLFFGTIGDKIGRKWVLVVTIVLMGGASTLVGALPTYDTIGIWAPILLVFLRLCQGFGAGAEFGIY